jgi:glycine betaine/proline transport system permease protein
MQPYRIPVGNVIELIIDFFVEHFSFLTKAFSEITEAGIDILVDAMMFVHPLLLILAITALTWYLNRSKGVSLFALIGLLLIWNMGLWDPTVSTIALVLIATFFAILVGVPLGILAALNRIAFKIIMPILDFMQTMPAFVYLIPAIPFFGLGPVAAIFSTVIFSMPPAIRLTSLGIKQTFQGPDAHGNTNHYGRYQPNHYAFSFHGCYCRHDWRQGPWG